MAAFSVSPEIDPANLISGTFKKGKMKGRTGGRSKSFKKRQGPIRPLPFSVTCYIFLSNNFRYSPYPSFSRSALGMKRSAAESMQ